VLLALTISDMDVLSEITNKKPRARTSESEFGYSCSPKVSNVVKLIPEISGVKRFDRTSERVILKTDALP
jgi:hypothetical protein